MTTQLSLYRRHRFPAEIISYAVSLYHLFSLSLRDVELILAEHGVVVTRESICHWSRKFGAAFAKRHWRPRPGDTWHSDDVFIRLNGVLWTNMGSCWTSWCRRNVMVLQPSGSASAYCTDCSISPSAS